jgi:hypothetical protein
LDDLDVVASGILGGQQRERSAGSRLDALNVTVDPAFWIGVDRERHLVNRPHVVELNLLEVRRHPDLIRHEHGQVGARLDELANCGGQVDDTPRLGRRHYRVRQIEFRLVMLRFSLPKACDGAAPLGLQRLDLPLRQFEGRLRARKGSLLLVKLRGILLGVLNAAIAGLPKVLVSRRLLLCEHQRRLCQIYLRLVGSDLGLLHVELRIDVLDTGLRRRDLSVCLLECRAIITIVDTGDHVAGFDMLVVRDGDRGNVARHFLRNRGLPCRYEGIFG